MKPHRQQHPIRPTVQLHMRWCNRRSWKTTAPWPPQFPLGLFHQVPSRRRALQSRTSTVGSLSQFIIIEWREPIMRTTIGVLVATTALLTSELAHADIDFCNKTNN